VIHWLLFRWRRWQVRREMNRLDALRALGIK
jgi:hypothetical protein